ncbi:MAG: hypothetical protein HC888_00600 [Candidatus Competibacteraceae bacterium]|nr:hypothetical protein [Candidatus Competibacteraceae bacterium]
MQKPSFYSTIDFSKISAVAEQLRNHKQNKRDFIVPSALIKDAHGGILINMKGFTVPENKGNMWVQHSFTKWEEAEAFADKIGSSIGIVDPEKDSLEVTTSERAKSQLISKLIMPYKYYQELYANGLGHLARHNVDELLASSKDQLLVRCMHREGPSSSGMHIRAILSNKYRCMDNYDLFFHAASEIQKKGADIVKVRLDDDGRYFEITACHPQMAAVVNKERSEETNIAHRWSNRLKGMEDWQRAAVVINNSETGDGGLNVRQAIITDVCFNTSIVGTLTRAIHIGGRNEKNGEIDWAADTRVKEAEVVWLKVRDAIDHSFDEVKFKEAIDAMNGLTKIQARSEDAQVKLVDWAMAGSLSDKERDRILANISNSGDLTAYGVLQGITELAHESETGEKAAALEAAGGKILSAGTSKIRQLVA